MAPQAPLSKGFSGQEYWSGLPCPPPGDLPPAEAKAASPGPPALGGGFFTEPAEYKQQDFPRGPAVKGPHCDAADAGNRSGNQAPTRCRAAKPVRHATEPVATRHNRSSCLHDREAARRSKTRCSQVNTKLKKKKANSFGQPSNRSVQFSSAQPLSHVRLSATPWTAARQASLSITNSRSSLRLTSIESVMPSNHLILCRPLLLLPSIFPSIRVFSSESVLRIRWPKYWSFSFSISPYNEYLGLNSFRMDWLDLLAVQRTLKSLL